jgi:predicted TIM-barrel fold metal-dependent hydrolase
VSAAPDIIICDAQVHAPRHPHIGLVEGIDGDDLLIEMDEAGVDQCVLVPLEHPGGDEMASNVDAMELAASHPSRFAVMGCFELSRRDNVALLPTWKAPGMLGARVSFVRDPNRGLLATDDLEWFWSAAEAADIPLMVLVPELVDKVAGIASRHPGLRLIVDHLALTPHVRYDDLGPSIAQLAPLAKYPNVAVKASALPCSVPEPFPFPSLREPLARVMDWFGPHRVFWGSDLTRLPCSYIELVRFFRDELQYPSATARTLVLGAGLLKWLAWNPAPVT